MNEVRFEAETAMTDKPVWSKMLKKQQREIPIRSVSGFEDGLLIFVKNGESSLVRSKNGGTGMSTPWMQVS